MSTAPPHRLSGSPRDAAKAARLLWLPQPKSWGVKEPMPPLVVRRMGWLVAAVA